MPFSVPALVRAQPVYAVGVLPGRLPVLPGHGGTVIAPVLPTHGRR